MGGLQLKHFFLEAEFLKTEPGKESEGLFM